MEAMFLGAAAGEPEELASLGMRSTFQLVLSRGSFMLAARRMPLCFAQSHIEPPWQVWVTAPRFGRACRPLVAGSTAEASALSGNPESRDLLGEARSPHSSSGEH